MRNEWGMFIQSYGSRAEALAALERMKAALLREGVRTGFVHMKQVLLSVNGKGHRSWTWDIYLKGYEHVSRTREECSYPGIAR